MLLRDATTGELTHSFSTTHMSLFFDQPLYLDGTLSLEHIYHHGKLPEIDESLEGFCVYSIAAFTI